MAAPRRVVELAFSDEEVAELARVARSRREPASQVERARMLLAYRETLSFYAVGRDIYVTHQTVERYVRRAERLGVLAALDDSPRPGAGAGHRRSADLHCRSGLPESQGPLLSHELWTTRPRHARSGYVVQDPRGARGQAAQGALLS